MVEEKLKQLGLSEKETDVYLAILRSGKTTPARVSRDTGINRATVYANAKTLTEKGLISEDLGGKTLYLVAEPVTSFLDTISKEKKALLAKEKVAKSAMEELSELTRSIQYSVPKIKFIEEARLSEYLYKQSPVWTESTLANKTTYLGIQDPTFVENYSDWIDWYWQTMDKRVALKLLTAKSKFEKELPIDKYERRQLKYWPEVDQVSATIWIMGSYIAMIQTQVRPHYIVEIHDAALGANLQKVFQSLWDKVD